MTCREKLKMEHPDKVGNEFPGGCVFCPSSYGYLDDPLECNTLNCGGSDLCSKCWDREIPETGPADSVPTEEKATYKLPDSGNRRKFNSGAVRDMAEGKGRCDLLPLDIMADLIGGGEHDKIIGDIVAFQNTSNPSYLTNIFYIMVEREIFEDIPTMFLEVAKHFEAGCVKYGENNWRKGIPVKFYIDSAVRHYLKYLRGDTDEPHDRAFCWNILCAIWTCEHMPELNEYRTGENACNEEIDFEEFK